SIIVAGAGAVPLSGVAVEIDDYRFADLGYRSVDVENVTTRFVGGLRGQFRGFDWESALLYSKARTEDEMDGVSMTGLQAAINRTTSDAYNPFVAGDMDNPPNAVFGVNNQDAID